MAEEKKTNVEEVKSKKGSNKVKNARLVGQSISGRFDREIVLIKTVSRNCR